MPQVSEPTFDKPRAILIFKQNDFDGNGRVALTDGAILSALVAHCDGADITTNKPQYGFFSDGKTGPWKAFFDEEVVDQILEEGNILQVSHVLPVAQPELLAGA